MSLISSKFAAVNKDAQSSVDWPLMLGDSAIVYSVLISFLSIDMFTFTEALADQPVTVSGCMDVYVDT